VLITPKQIVTINVLYYRPDYTSLLQEFVWSLDDHVPELTRTHRFLWHWKHNIDAVIKEIVLGVNAQHYNSYQSVDQILKLH
jgi:uncharacterized protein Usg